MILCLSFLPSSSQLLSTPCSSRLLAAKAVLVGPALTLSDMALSLHQPCKRLLNGPEPVNVCSLRLLISVIYCSYTNILCSVCSYIISNIRQQCHITILNDSINTVFQIQQLNHLSGLEFLLYDFVCVF
ncbi:hypothetical protein CHARACLAT_033627 [Characodon lateralis]|uniref:Uncharacterized protein n=1 Tax=Characodon lateralis TaxID=208331 RepID=A0ABU7CVQ1_9TELE|nr:hypothetical protein [Characodon lateralis]